MINEKVTCRCVCHVSSVKCCAMCVDLAHEFAKSIDQKIVDESFSKEDEDLIQGLSQCSNTPLSLYKFLSDWRYEIMSGKTELSNFITKANEVVAVYHKDFNTRIKRLEDLFSGINLKSIHDAMESYIKDFNKRLQLLENVGYEKCLDQNVKNADYSQLNNIAPDLSNVVTECNGDYQYQIDRLEKNIFSLSEKFDKEIRDVRKGIKPFKCPSCDGFGWREILLPNDLKADTSKCISCENKGIVWG